jgi:hypothetical protein
VTAPLETVELLINGKVAARASATKSPPTIKKVELLQPKAPKDALASSAGSALTVRWAAADADGDALTYRVETSVDEGKSWQVVALAIKDTQLALGAGQLAPKGRKLLVRITANDGWHTSLPATAHAK